MFLTKVSFSMIQGAMLNALDFGAVGNGTTDDTVAIQAALTAGTAQKKLVFLPAGTYRISDILYVENSGIIGEGKDSTNIAFYTSESIAGTGSFILRDFSVYISTWVSGTIPGGLVYPAGHLISTFEAENFLIDNLIVKQTDVRSFNIQNSDKGTISNCTVFNGNGDGIHIQLSRDIKVVNNTVYGMVDDDVSLTAENGGPAAAWPDLYRVIVTGNTFPSNDRARAIVVDGGYDVIISNNAITQNADNGLPAIGLSSATIYATRPTYNINIIGNIIVKKTGSSFSNQCISIKGAIENVIIQANTFSSTTEGITFDNYDNANTNKNIIINDNQFIDIGQSILVSENNSLQGIAITNNIFRNGAADRQIYLKTGFGTASVLGNKFNGAVANTFVELLRVEGTTADRLILDDNLFQTSTFTSKADIGPVNLTIGYNQIDAISIDASAYRNKNSGIYVANGTGALQTFTIPHLIGGSVGRTPTSYGVTVASADAAISYYTTISSTLITVQFASAPILGTGNVKIAWFAEFNG